MRNRRKAAMIVAIALAALMLLPMIISGVLSLMAPDAQAAVTQKDLDKLKGDIKKLKDNLSALGAKKKDLKNELAKNSSVMADIVEKKFYYDGQIEATEQEMEIVGELLSELNLAIAGQQQALDEAREKEAVLWERYVARVRAMESLGEISYLGILLQAESITDLMTRWDGINEIMSRDKKLAEELTRTRLEIEATMAELAEDKQEQYDYKRQVAEAHSELAQLSADTDKMMAEYMAEIARIEALVAKTAEEERLSQKNLNDAQKELDAQEKIYKKYLEEQARRNNPYVGGDYQWPVPGYYYVNVNGGGGFGMRIHPIYKVKKMHNGIDVGAPKGTKITAANAGTIILREYSSSYGNYVIIDHGGKQATLYAHMSAFADGQKVGSTVSTGDVIGYIGSTGLSTGPHLHFEIHLNGKPVDPLAEGRLKGKK